MKRLLFLFAIIFFGCDTSTTSIDGTYVGWVGYTNVKNGRSHTGQVFVSIEEIEGLYYVTTTDPPYPIDSNGWGNGIEQETDTVYDYETYMVNDSTFATRISDTTYIERLKNEEVFAEGGKLQYTVRAETIIDGTKTVVNGSGELIKTN